MVARTPSDKSVYRGSAPEALSRYAPEAAARLEALIGTEPQFGQQRLAALARDVCAQTLSLESLAMVRGVGDSSSLDAVQQFAVDFAEQFSIDVSRINDATRSELLRLLGEQARAFVSEVYIADWAPRIYRVLDQLFSPSPDGWAIAVRKPESGEERWPVVDAFMRSVAQLRVLDPVTTEIVRLREARQHNCRMCKSLRSRPALAAGIGEETFDEIDRFENSTLSARHKAALALTDAVIWQPGYIADGVIANVRVHFSPAEAVELLLDMMRNASSKIAVALGSDEAHVTEGFEIYDINDDGTLDFGLSAPAE